MLFYLCTVIYITSWSYRMNELECQDFQKKVIKIFDKNYDFYKSKTINLDFHTIPHYGEESELEKVWSGSKNKVTNRKLFAL